MAMSTIIVGDIVPMKDRGTYQGLMGGVWGVSSVLGPLIGGILSDKASWRWCFFMFVDCLPRFLTLSSVELTVSFSSRIQEPTNMRCCHWRALLLPEDR